MEITTMAQAMQFHAHILKRGDPEAQPRNLSKLFTFYALSPSGDLAYARRILKSLKTRNSYYCNTMIRAYSQGVNPIKSIDFFLEMRESCELAAPDKFTYPFMLKACARMGLRHLGWQVYGLVWKLGLVSDLYVQNGFIHMCCSCGESGYAYKVFEKMPVRDVVSWTSMIYGFVDDGRHLGAIKLFNEMLEAEVEPNGVTFVAVLGACAEVGALGMGMKVHELVEMQVSSLMDANISSALIDMYAKCGCLDRARKVFDGLSKKNVVIWTAMINGLASHGKCGDALDMFEMMVNAGIRPDVRTMTAVLSACRNGGLVKESLGYIGDMENVYGLRPAIQHYGCVVDLLARAGHLADAEEFIRKMPIEADEVLWRTVIWACKVHGDTNRADSLIHHLKLQNDCGSYVLVGNVYASAGKWADKARVRHIMKKNGIIKPPASSKVEIDGIIHDFAAGDSGHNEAENIYGKLTEVEEHLKREGYHPNLSEVLLEIDDEEKSFQLLHHSEKLAVAFALIKTSSETKIRIVKNLRSCKDCHSFIKLISKIYHREIIVRDRVRFHHFREGECSCCDYW